MPATPHALSLLPLGHTRTHFVHNARDFVSRHARVFDARPQTLFCEHVTVTDTTGLHLDAYLFWTRLGNLAVDNLEIGSCLRNHRYLHWCYCDPRRCHMSSHDSSNYCRSSLAVLFDECSDRKAPNSIRNLILAIK